MPECPAKRRLSRVPPRDRQHNGIKEKAMHHIPFPVRHRRTSAALLLAAAATLLNIGVALIPAMAHADELPTARVRVSDLDLASAEGQRTLELRIRTAIEKVCAPPEAEPVEKLRSRVKLDKCREEARASVARQLAEGSLARNPG